MNIPLRQKVHFILIVKGWKNSSNKKTILRSVSHKNIPISKRLKNALPTDNAICGDNVSRGRELPSVEINN